MKLSVFDAASPEGLAAWLRAWDAWPGREVQAHPEYVRLFARPGDRVLGVYGEGKAGGALFPLILRPLSAEPWAAGDGRWDAVSPYGYGGPYAWGERDDAGYWRAFRDWAAAERVVSVFSRLSLFPGHVPELPVPATPNAENVVVPVSRGEKALWEEYDKNVRNAVRRAEKEGVTVERDDAGAGIDEFMSVYAETMARVSASSFYLFPRSFYETLFSKLRGHVAFFHARREGKLISSDIVLLSAENAYYFLSGSTEAGYAYKPGYLLKHREILWLGGLGKKGFVLGGSYVKGDGLFRFKHAFAPGGLVPFRTLGWTLDEKAAAELAAARGAGWAPRPGFFPPYRS